jgi:rubrerythrin
MGVRFETNKVVGKTFTIPQLLGERGFDAVFVGTGAGAPTFLGIPGEFAGQVYSANEFLTRVNLMGGDKFPYEDTPVTLGRSIVVIGAGNTAMDCLRVSKRLGAELVRCVYRRTKAEAPARVEELRHAEEEGITFHWLRGPTEIVTDDKGGVKALVCQKMELGPPDASGRRRPVPIPGEMETFECDTVIYALGTRANPIIARSTPGLDVRGEGYINVDETTQAANLPGVFAGGDIVTGAATVILALGAGRRAARAITSYLKNRVWPPEVRAESKIPAVAAPAESVCKKCRRPIEEGEDYVCCALERLSFQCTSCQKVSEGFAFPYGLCPICGGAFAPREELSTPEGALAEAVRRAYEIEIGGVLFYARGAEEMVRAGADPEVIELFNRLSAMEREHMETLARRYHLEAPDLSVGGPSPSQLAVFSGVETSKDDDGVALLRLAVHLEKRAGRFFLETGRAFSEASPEWRLYRELEEEEREHAELLEGAAMRLKAGRPLVI